MRETAALALVHPELAALLLCAVAAASALRHGLFFSGDYRTARPRRRLVNVWQLLLALLFSPFVLFFWAVTSLGEAADSFFRLLLASLSILYSFFAAMVGAAPVGAWRSGKSQLRQAAGGCLRICGNLLACFGFRGLVEHLRESARRPPSPPPLPARPGGGPEPATYPFEDRYRIESQLGTGGSTARLFVVRRVERNLPVGEKMALKFFDLGRGSRLEEVIRESRGMQVAKDMGIVLDHDLARDHFYYVMPFYEGETLTRAAARIHRPLRPDEGLSPEDTQICLGWMSELLRILDGYHRHGVIHKDVKPDNVIVTEEGLRLVDLGLLTPLASALTITTHGTEYFRDPEMVRLSIQGRRVRDIDAVRFDVYSAGAVLYHLFEGSFPACGPLSRYSRSVPMAISWITSRAMAEGDKRYPSIAVMRADLEALLEMWPEEELDRVPVSRLPSFSGLAGAPDHEPPPPPRPGPTFRTVPSGPRPPAKRPGRFLPALLGILLALGSLCGLVLAVRFVDRRPEAASVPAGSRTTPEAAFVLERFQVWWAQVSAGDGPSPEVRVVVAAPREGELSALAAQVRFALRERGVDASVLHLGGRGEAKELAAATGNGEGPPFVLWLENEGGGGDRRLAVRGYHLDREHSARLPVPGGG